MLPLPAKTEEEFCLSGGFRNGYSCDVPLFSELNSRTSTFSVQLLERGDERTLSELEQVVHISELEGNKRLVYLGRYDTQIEGMAAMQKTLRKYGAGHHPMLVALTPSAQMPRIRLVAEPNIAAIGGEASRRLAGPLEQAQSVTTSSSRVYAIQLGAFKGVNDAKQFSAQLNAKGLLCRQKDNGLYAVYYRRFNSSREAFESLGDYSFIDELGGYVVALTDVQFSQCRDLPTPKSSASEVLAGREEGLRIVDPKSAELTRSSKAAEPEATVVQDSETKSHRKTSGSGVSAEVHELVYSLQIAAFKHSSAAKRFIAKHSDVPMLCRTKDNGLFTVYYGTYSSLDEARSHMNDHSLLSRQKSYAVKLTHVTFEQCR